MPRFVILEHDWPTLHWDFLLEAGSVLRAWRLLGEPGPVSRPQARHQEGEPALGVEVSTEPNADHRLFYLDYEGPVSGGRGIVRRWDSGTFEWITDEPGRVVVELRGAKLVGRCVIEAGRCRFGHPHS